MKKPYSIFMLLFAVVSFGQPIAQPFNLKKDLLLVHFDCKTDVDDLHTVAGLYTLVKQAPYKKMKYHAVAGTYGMQEGLYVPGNELFQMAFGKNWSDAHTDKVLALKRVSAKAKAVLKKGGDIWIAEAGQSDFSAALIRVLKAELLGQDMSKRIHIVQHSEWNQEVTNPTDLAYVKNEIHYQKIPDGNTVGNGTPGFRTPGYTEWKVKLKNKKLLQVWQLAVDLGQKYNGKEGRYVNQAVVENGLDFSDLSEVCWILGLQDLKDTDAFFSRFGY